MDISIDLTKPLSYRFQRAGGVKGREENCVCGLGVSSLVLSTGAQICDLWNRRPGGSFDDSQWNGSYGGIKLAPAACSTPPVPWPSDDCNESWGDPNDLWSTQLQKQDS